MNKLDSSVISVLRFPLIVGVVCIHCGYGGGVLQYLLGGICGKLSVPIFLLISGYLFFREGSYVLTKELWTTKLKKRISSLLVPYLLWNFIGYIIYALQAGFSFDDFFHSFWVIDIPGRGGSSPIDGPLWYVRNLMIMVVISPIIAYMIKYTKCYLILIMTILWIIQIPPFNKGIGIAFYFFSLGGYLRVFDYHVENLQRYAKYLILAYPIYVIYAFLMQSNSNCWDFQLGILLGIGAIFSLTIHLIKNGSGNCKFTKILSETSFFIYCLHDLLLQFLKPFFSEILGTGNSAYISLIVVDIALCLGFFYVLKRISPKVTSLLIGGR